MAKGAYIGVQTPSGGIGDLTVGSIVKLKENGSAVDYIVVHQGNPDSSLYDSSCNGTWLLRKDCYENRVWHNSAVHDYENSDIDAYLNSDFLNVFDTSVKTAIKEVKIPYRAGTGKSMTITSGANGLSTKAFLLSATELGNVSTSAFPNTEGVKLSYFEGCAETAADDRRIAYLDGAAVTWWTRTPYCIGNQPTSGIYVNKLGKWMNAYVTNSYGIRPALILPQTLAVGSDGLIDGSEAAMKPLARKIKKSYIGVGNVARKIKKAYIGIGGVARLFFALQKKLLYDKQLSNLDRGSMCVVAERTANHAIFAGGCYDWSSSTGRNTSVAAYDRSGTKTTCTAMSDRRSRMAHAYFADKAIFAGGDIYTTSSTGGCTTVEAYDNSLTKTTLTALSGKTKIPSGARNSNYFLVALGIAASSAMTTMNAYNTSLTRTTTPVLSVARHSSISIGNSTYAMFAGGSSGSTKYSTVDCFNNSLTRTTATALSVARSGIGGGATINENIIIAGGSTSSGFSNALDIYSPSLTRTSGTLINAAGEMDGASGANYAAISGGGTSVQTFDASLVTELSTSLPAKIVTHASTFVYDKLFIGGGHDGNDNPYSAVYLYSEQEI